MVNEEKDTMLVFAVYDKVYERYNVPMFFPDIKTANVEIERSIRAQTKDYPKMYNDYLDELEIRNIGMMDMDTGKLYNMNEEEMYTIHPKDYCARDSD